MIHIHFFKTIFLLLFLSTIGISQMKGNKTMQQGAATPEELLQYSAKAIQEKRFDDFQTLYFAQSEKEKKEVFATIELLKLWERIEIWIKNGNEKFGGDFYNAIDAIKFELNLAAVPNYSSAKKIKLSKIQDDEFASTTLAYKDLLTNSEDYQGYGMEKHAGRWYHPLPTKRVVLAKAMEQCVTQLEKLLLQEKNAQDIVKKVKPLRDLFNEYYEL